MIEGITKIETDISDEELQKIMEDFKNTRLIPATIKNKEQAEFIRDDELLYLKQLEEQARLARIPLDSYLNHLVKVYNLSQADTLELETGKIVRVEAK